MERKAEYCLTQIFHYLVNGLAAIVFFCALPIQDMHCGITGAY